MDRNRNLKITGILTAALLAQLAGHFLLLKYMPNAMMGGAIGVLLVSMIFSYVLFIRRDVFSFIMLVYIISHFSYGDHHGGLINVAAFVVLALYLVVNKVREGFPRRDIVMFTLLLVFILSNMLGWVIKNPVPIVPKFTGIAAFFGFILMFHLTSNMLITKERFRLFLVVTFIMVLYQFIVALNQRYGLVDWYTPLVGGYVEAGKLSGIAKGYAPTAGTISHFELFGEYGALLMCLLVPFLSSSSTQSELRFGINRIVVMIFICLSFTVLTSNRAAAILSVLVFALYYLVLPMRIFSSIDRFGRQIRVILVVALLVPLIGTYVGLTELGEDFSSLANKNLSTDSVISGESINRGGLVTGGLMRIKQESWWVGYGYGVPRSNRWAWFGMDPEIRDSGVKDYHSLYLSLPMVYGWIGSIAFLSMIVITAVRLFRVSWKYRKREGFLMVLAVGFTMFWFVFMIDQYKISILRAPNYQMMFWIWLGLSNAVVKTIRYEKREISAPTLSLGLGRKDGVSQ